MGKNPHFATIVDLIRVTRERKSGEKTDDSYRVFRVEKVRYHLRLNLSYKLRIETRHCVVLS